MSLCLLLLLITFKNVLTTDDSSCSSTTKGLKLLKRSVNVSLPRVTITESMKAQYWDKGYLILHSVFTEDECNLLQNTITNDPSILSNTMSMVDKEGKESKLTLWFTLGDDIYSLFGRSSTIYNAVQELIDTEPYMFHSKIMMKEPKIGGAWEFHQDYGYWYEQGGMIPNQLLSVMIAIDHHNIHNGCLQILEESHKFGRLQHGIYNDQTMVNPIRLQTAKTHCKLIHAILNPGDVLIFHSLLIHGSDANNSSDWRKALITGYNGRYAPIHIPEDKNQFVIPGYTQIHVVSDDDIIKSGVKPHASNRNDFFSREDNIDSFTPKVH